MRGTDRPGAGGRPGSTAALIMFAGLLLLPPEEVAAASSVPDPKCGLPRALAAAGLTAPSAPGEDADAPDRLPAPWSKILFQRERIVGLFLLRYDTAGVDAPAMLDAGGNPVPGSHEEFVDSAGRILNEVHAVLTGPLGYADPIQPGQGPYEVRIANSVYYGETVPGARIGASTPARYLSHMRIDNDFRNFYSSGMDGLKVTAAHEFFHAVQFGSYGYWTTDVWFMELTSTWMEDLLYDGINDYYQYLRGPAGPGGYTARGHFAKPDFSLLRTDGITEYSRAILGKFLEKRHSPEVVRRAWELVPTAVAATALDRALGEWSSSFREAFLLWASWNARTGPDADTAAYYAEGREYPRIATAPIIDFTPPARTIADTIGTASAGYYPVLVGGEPMSVIVANLRTSGAAASAPFAYEMATSGDDTWRKLSNGLYVRLSVPDPSHWATLETAPAVIAAVTAAPNPFTAGNGRPLRFHLPATTRPADVRLAVFAVGMERIFAGPLGLRDDLATPFAQVAEWDPSSSGTGTVPSGVYIYVLTVDGREHTGKFTVIR